MKPTKPADYHLRRRERIAGHRCVYLRYGWCEGCVEETCFHWWLDGRCYWCRVKATASGVSL